MMNTGNQDLIFSFPDESASFVNGFEAGMLWQRLQSGQSNIEQIIHTENVTVITNMVLAKGMSITVTKTEYDEWSNITVTNLASFKLSIVRCDDEY